MQDQPDSATNQGGSPGPRSTEAATSEREAWAPTAEARTDLLSALADRVARSDGLDELVSTYTSIAALLPRRVAATLRGEGLGHPAHPMLVDLPIGFWTSGWALDLLGGHDGAPMARRLIGLGVLSAVPAFASGLAEFELIEDPGQRRVAAFHAVSNAAATSLFALSWKARRSHRGVGIILTQAASAAATLGGALGGHLAFALGVGQSPHLEPPPERRVDEVFDGPGADATGLISDATRTSLGDVVG